MVPIGVVYFGLISAFLGVVSLIKPLRFMGILTRQRALIVVAAGLLIVVIGCVLPAKETRISQPRTQLDQFMPVYQFSEFHSIRIAASKEKVYWAVKRVTADEILFFRTLIWIRRGGRSSPESILNPGKKPLLDVATGTSFLLLSEEVNREIVVGTVITGPPGWRSKRTAPLTPEDFKTMHDPGFVLATLNFRIEDSGPAECNLTTETRVYATDASARRSFAAYWRVIYPGSSLVRYMWLRAIKKRAMTNTN